MFVPLDMDYIKSKFPDVQPASQSVSRQSTVSRLVLVARQIPRFTRGAVADSVSEVNQQQSRVDSSSFYLYSCWLLLVEWGNE